jgi:hypothetical protein
VAAAVSNLRRLGYLSFDSNERSNHQARELKSVHVSVEAQLVRLLIHRCHVNKLNIYNQVREASLADELTAMCLLRLYSAAMQLSRQVALAIFAGALPLTSQPGSHTAQIHANAVSCNIQVGIVALNLIGEPLQPTPEGPPGYLDVDGPVSHELQYYNRAAAEVADLQLDVHVDSSTAARIKVRC